MTEGTKIGEYKDTNDFNSSANSEQENTTNSTLASDSSQTSGMTATKRRDVSDFEKSLEEVMDEVEATTSSEENLFISAMEQSVSEFEPGDVVKGTVRSIERGGVFVDFKYKSDGYIAPNEFSNDPNETPRETLNVGDNIDVQILKLETKEGYSLLSKKRAEYDLLWIELADLIKSKEPVTVSVLNRVNGGLVVAYKGVRGFIPASQIVENSIDELDQYVNKPVEAIVLQVDKRRKKVIFSHKAILSKSKKEALKEKLDEIEVGQVLDGKVTSVKDFGAFVDIGGIEGLVHISEMSWSRVSHPSDLVEVGQEVKVFVLGVDKENAKISLGMKQLEADPWVEIGSKFQVGQDVKGTITRTTSFGAFIEIAKDIEGLIHISELADKRIQNVNDVVKPGDEVEARIIKLIPEEQRVGLSIRELDRERRHGHAQELTQSSTASTQAASTESDNTSQENPNTNPSSEDM